jgi:hypothetical protein
MISTKYQDITVNTTPSGAVATYANSRSCITPCVLQVERCQKPRILVVRKDGYIDQIIMVNSNINNWVFGNLIFGVFGGIVGAIVDGSTGAIYELTPTNISVFLQEK